MGILKTLSKGSKGREPLPIRRDIHFILPHERIHDWHNKAGPIFTALVNTFSIVLPVGERFFIDAVRAHRSQVTDPELQKAVTAFIGQEAMHGREHEVYNDALYARRPEVKNLEKVVSGLFAWIQKYLPSYMWLSGTIALEHFTALLADSVLRDPRLLDGAEQDYANIWRWHAFEETEHKSVAFDVWNTVKGHGPRAYIERTGGLVVATVIFWSVIVPTFLIIVKNERKLLDLSSWLKMFRYTFGKIGVLRQQAFNYLDYFRPNFHPWDHDNREYMQQMQSLIYQLDHASNVGE